MAIAPIDAEAAAAQTQGWEIAERSLSTGKIVTAMIFVAVPLTYILESFVPLLIGVPVIVIFIGAKSIALLRGGGEIDRAYDSSARAIAPLGLELIERPQVGAGPRWGPAPGMKTEISGRLEYSGKRHGRYVEVRWEDGACDVYVAAAAAEFEARSTDRRVRSKQADLPGEVATALEAIPRSAAWKNLRLSSDGKGIRVRRKPLGESASWLCDLWLAERLADALS